MKPLLLGLDVGTSRIKALLMDSEGHEWASAAGPTPFVDGEMTTDDLATALAGVIGQLGDARSPVEAVGIAGIAESGAPLSADGRPLAPIIAWHDTRGAEVVDRLQRQFGPDLERAIGQRLRVVSSAAKLGWLVDHGVAGIARWLGVPELVLHLLAGRDLTEFSLAARTGAYHVEERRYLPEVVAALGVGPDVFPPVGAAGAVMGSVTVDGAAWSGLQAGIPVTIAGHDHLAARAGCGAGAADLVDSVGTAEVVVAGSRHLPDIGAALAQRVAVTVMPGGDGWAILASAVRAGVVVNAIADALDGGSAEALDRAAAGARPTVDADGLIDDALAGRPLRLAGAPGAIWSGVLAALSARTWYAVDRLSPVVPGGLDPAGRLVVCGGGSRSPAWLRAKASLRPATTVLRCRSPEAVARGAALYAGVAAGWWLSVGAGPPPALEVVPGSR